MLMIIVVGVLLVGLIAGCLFQFRRSAGRARKELNRAGYPLPHRVSVTVRLESPRFGVCCKAARRFDGRIFPEGEAPSLPLPGCTMSHCRCRYRRMPEPLSRGKAMVSVGRHCAAIPDGGQDSALRFGV